MPRFESGWVNSSNTTSIPCQLEFWKTRLANRFGDVLCTICKVAHDIIMLQTMWCFKFFILRNLMVWKHFLLWDCLFFSLWISDTPSLQVETGKDTHSPFFYAVLEIYLMKIFIVYPIENLRILSFLYAIKRWVAAPLLKDYLELSPIKIRNIWELLWCLW